MLNTKIVSILMALAMFAGLGALAADSAAPISTNCHQKECKTSWMPVNKDPKCMDKNSWMPVNKDPKSVWCTPCKQTYKDPKGMDKSTWMPVNKNPKEWKNPCNQATKEPKEWKNYCHSICKNHTPTVPVTILG